MELALSLISTYRLGDIASIIGVVISLTGFAFTLLNVIRSKRAAEEANISVARVRSDLIKMENVVEFSSVLNNMEEIKALHREKAWRELAGKYSSLRKSLISIKCSMPDLSKSHQVAIQEAIQQLYNLESVVDKVLSGSSKPISVSKLNNLINTSMDKLHQVLVEIKLLSGR